MRGWESESRVDIRDFQMSRIEESASFSGVLKNIRTTLLDWLIAPWRRSSYQGQNIVSQVVSGRTKTFDPNEIGQPHCAIFFFSKSRLASLKAMASLSMHGDDDNTWISTQDALAALLGSCIHSTSDEKVCPIDDISVVTGTVVNVRRFLNPPLPADYIGNALGFVQVLTPLHTVQSTPENVAKVARMIRKQIKEFDERSARERIAALWSARWKTRSPLEGTVHITSWATQRFYDLDWGNVIGTRIERVRRISPFRSITIGANCTILPELATPHFGAEECGLEVALANFGPEHIGRLKQNELFMQYAEWRCN